MPRLPEEDGPTPDYPTPEDVLPPGTETVIKRHGDLTVTVRPDLWDVHDYFDVPDDDLPSHVIFGEGESIPLSVAALTWDGFSDQYECKDASGVVIDEAER